MFNITTHKSTLSDVDGQTTDQRPVVCWWSSGTDGEEVMLEGSATIISSIVLSATGLILSSGHLVPSVQHQGG